MAPSQPSRHLTTVLFLDIVGSTRVASELGDARWHTLLASFRREVGHRLRAHHGREENFTGDGILATFPAPEEAVECAVRIARSVQDLGLDVRAGVHTGQVETIQGQLGGVAVHIGARVMAFAGDAEVLVTSTTRDLLRGSGVVFGEPTTHELKGVSGSWEVVPVRSIGTLTAPEPIDPRVAAERLDQIEAVARRRRKRDGRRCHRRRRRGAADRRVGRPSRWIDGGDPRIGQSCAAGSERRPRDRRQRRRWHVERPPLGSAVDPERHPLPAHTDGAPDPRCQHRGGRAAADPG